MRPQIDPQVYASTPSWTNLDPAWARAPPVIQMDTASQSGIQLGCHWFTEPLAPWSRGGLLMALRSTLAVLTESRDRRTATNAPIDHNAR